MSADFSEVSKFSAGKNFKSLEFASGVPLLEVELDELQDIQNYRRELFIKTFISNGFVTKNDMSLASSTLTVPSDILVINGEIFEVLEDMVITVESGDTVYLAFSVENVIHSDILKNSGNLSGGTEITNDIQDPRSTEETSRRNQIQVQLTKVNTDPAKVYLTVATITGASAFTDNRVTVSLINTNTNASTVLVTEAIPGITGDSVQEVLEGMQEYLTMMDVRGIRRLV